MIESVTFMIGVLAGQVSLILGYIFAWLWGPYMKQGGKTPTSTKKKDNVDRVCPFCSSKKIGYTETPGTMFCSSCMKEFNNGGNKPNK